MRLFRRAAAIAALGCCLAALPGGTLSAEPALDVPDPRRARGGWVTDLAGILPAEAADSLDAICAALARARGAEMAFAIVRNTGDESPRAFATALFRRWGVGRAGHDDGLLVLLVVESRRIEVETGYGLEGVLPDGRIGAILDRDVIPRFREGDWGGGLIGAARAFDAAIRAGAPPAPEAPRPRGAPRGWAWALGGLLALAAAALGVRRLRFCPRCRRPMRLLDERQDDVHLSELDRLEESLHSVDHRVWRCDRCAILRSERFRNPFAAFDDCPKCLRRTRSLERVILRPATRTREGLAEVTRTCRNPACAHREKVREDLPRLPEPSSAIGSSSGSSSGRSSGGSFGGGRSGGGGAGRSW